MNTEEIIWAAIKDIENGSAKLMSEDPINGFLQGKNKKLTKSNISNQSAKYNELNDFKPISRPTIDTYTEIVNYIKLKTNKSSNEERLLEENKLLKLKNEELKSMVKQMKEYADGVAFENLKLNEILKFNK